MVYVSHRYQMLFSVLSFDVFLLKHTCRLTEKSILGHIIQNTNFEVYILDNCYYPKTEPQDQTVNLWNI